MCGTMNGAAFLINKPDFKTSPFTGMSRRRWMAAAQHLLNGVFRHVRAMDQPVLLPRQHKISYPQPGDPPYRFKAEEFEGLARTLMAAAPLIAENPDVECHGIRLKDYYTRQILAATDPSSPRYLGKISDFNREFGKRQHQHTCEGAVLALGLMLAEKQLWDPLNAAQKKQIADLISGYAHERTIGQNWRLFNLLMLTFLKRNGFSIDEAVMQDHLQNVLADYAGDGWYADDVTYDMYNPWAYHSWLPLWCHFYGFEHEPEAAAAIQSHNREFVRGWSRMYARNGQQLMWGRSIIYRFGGASSLALHFLMNDPVLDPGFARRIASANMLQFIGREDVYLNGVPCLGYYGPFELLVQFYSCSASPFWFAQVFAALMLPETHPFWMEKETEGFWPQLGERSVELTLNSPAIHVVNHGKTGTTEVRTGKVSHHDPYYVQLQFNAHFCWEALTGTGANAGVYSIREVGINEPFRIARGIEWAGFSDGVLYRRMDMKRSSMGDVMHGGVHTGPEWIDLADITLPGGVLRVDRLRVAYGNELKLGHFALPHVNGISAEVKQFEAGGKTVLSASIPGRKVALVPIHGWSRCDSVQRKGLNPEAEASTVIYAEHTREADYSGVEVFITVMLHRLDDGEWTEDELMPVKYWEIIPWTDEGYPCAIRLELKDGRIFTIDYRNMNAPRLPEQTMKKEM